VSDAFRAGPAPCVTEPEYFDKRMALDVIEDALTDLNSPNSRGMATGLCSALYMCGLLDTEEWEGFLNRIPPEYSRLGTD